MHVLALREIVADIGADRGILLSESGFQRGAIEAANLTNVEVTSIAKLKASTENSVLAMRLHDLFVRLDICKSTYWDIPKSVRIAAGLRPEVGEPGYSGRVIIELCTAILARAFRGRYPFEVDTLEAITVLGKAYRFESARAVEVAVGEMLSELEERLERLGKRNRDG